MEVKCPKCGEVLIEVIGSSTGLVTHCGVSVRFEVVEDSIVTWEHSKSGYDPGLIFFDRDMKSSVKEMQLKVLRRRIKSAMSDSSYLGEHLHRCNKYIKEVSKTISNAINASRTNPMKGITWNKDTKAANAVWVNMILFHVRKHDPGKLTHYQGAFQNLRKAIDYAEKHGIPVLPHLKECK